MFNSVECLGNINNDTSRDKIIFAVIFLISYSNFFQNILIATSYFSCINHNPCYNPPLYY